MQAARRLDGSCTSFSYVYDAAGNVTRRTYKDGTIVDVTYDPLNCMSTVVSGGRTTGYAYDPASNVTTSTLPATNGFVETRVYDRAGRLNQVRNVKGATTLADITYTRDKVGNPLTETRTGASPVSKTFSYDNMDRLTGVCYLATLCPGATDPYIRHTYDGVGNRLTEARPSTATVNYGPRSGSRAPPSTRLYSHAATHSSSSSRGQEKSRRSTPASGSRSGSAAGTPPICRSDRRSRSRSLERRRSTWLWAWRRGTSPSTAPPPRTLSPAHA